MRWLWPIRVASKFMFFSFNLRLLVEFITPQKNDGKTTWCHFCGASNKWLPLFWTFTWDGSRSLGEVLLPFIFAVLVMIILELLATGFSLWPQHLEGVEHRCFTIIWGKWVRSWHDDGLSDCAFLESSMFRTSKSTIFRQGIRKYTWQILWFGSILPKGCSKLLVTFAWLHHLDVHIYIYILHILDRKSVV